MTGSPIPAFISTWFDALPTLTFDDLAESPQSVGIFSVDLINGFVHFGPLASPRVRAVVDPVVRLMFEACDAGIRERVLIQDTHTPTTPEFRIYPPHALAGTDESATIPELLGTPLDETTTLIQKNSINPAIGTDFGAWLDQNPDITTAIVVGDCTDLCVYQLAMHLRLRANALDLGDVRVIVPADCVDTFDTPEGDLPHPGEFFHRVFLYHMASNGIEVVRSIRASSATSSPGVVTL